MRNAFVVTLAAALGLIFGCESSQRGVKTNYHAQWTNVAADTKTTTDAAKMVLMDDGLRDVTEKSTKLDGTAGGKKADGTKIEVSVKKLSDTSSQVTVNVGKMGDPKVGADIARRIKDRAEHK